VLQGNIIQVYVFNILHLGYLGFSVYLVYQIDTAVFIANLMLLSVFFVVWPIVTRYLYTDFGWRVYRKIGADPYIQSELLAFLIS